MGKVWTTAFLVLLGMISAPAPASDDKKPDSSNEVPVHMVVTVKPKHNGGQVPALATTDEGALGTDDTGRARKAPAGSPQLQWCI